MQQFPLGSSLSHLHLGMLAEVCLRNPTLWREPRRRPSWVPDAPSMRPEVPRHYWRKDSGLWLPLSCAFSLIDSAKGATDPNSSTTDTFNAIGATLLVAIVASYGGGGVAHTVTDTEGNLGWVERALYGNGGIRVQLFDCLNPSVSAAMAVTYAAGSSYSSITVTAWSGNDLSDPFDDDTGFVTNASVIQAGPLTPPSGGCLFISGLSHENNSGGGVPTINGSFTRIQHVPYGGGVNEGGAQAYLIQGSAALEDPEWNIGVAADLATVLGTYLPATGGGPERRWILGTH